MFRIGIKSTLLLVVFFLGIIINAETLSNLQKTEILGKEYYLYDVKKNESIYGISKRFNWDIEELMRLNPDAANSLKKGDRIYYPTGKISVVVDKPEPIEIDFANLEPIKHKIKKGETIYSVSRQYNIPLETIYKYNPSSKKGVRTGDIIEIPQNGNSKYYFYKIKRGDTLSSISQQFNTSVEDILKNNAGLTVKNLEPDEIIRISLNSNVGRIKTELVEEDRVTQITSYKVSKNESWEDISEKTGVDVEILRESNNSEEKPKDNEVISVPTIETVEIEKTVDLFTQQEITSQEAREIYDSIKGVNPEKKMLEEVKVALILDDPTSNKDIDFTRGMLVGIYELKDSPFKIDFNVLDGRISTGDLIDELDDFEPNLIISTADRTFPLFLADYGNTNNVQIVNVFDLKNDLYEDNPSIIQILTPSDYFYNKIASKIFKENTERQLLAVGDPDDNDTMAKELFKLYEDNAENISLENFGSLEPDAFKKIIIYSYATKKEEVNDFITNLENLIDNNPETDYIVVGRTNWISMMDDFGDQFEEYNVYIPSRVWLDEDSKEWNNFTNEYEDLFGGYPIRSIPNFAASGYDVVKFFMPLVAENNGDFNQMINATPDISLQNEIELSRVNNWGGFINGNAYLLKFLREGKIEKILVK